MCGKLMAAFHLQVNAALDVLVAPQLLSDRGNSVARFVLDQRQLPQSALQLPLAVSRYPYTLSIHCPGGRLACINACLSPGVGSVVAT